jgi:hemerythrin-like domain-containing protein
VSPTDVLREEHEIILQALDVLEGAAERSAAGHAVAAAWWAAFVAWLRAFADRSHHAKEEAALFPAMVKAGVPSEGPIAVMLEEHAEGRRLVAAIESSGAAARIRACRAYVALLRDHIGKENGIVFPLAEAVLDERAVEGLRREFDAVEAEQDPAATLAGAVAALGPRAATLEAAG